jgi:DNA polymerase-3 subunit epsilon
MIREIVLDTETTGLDPFSGHRIVEIGCVELINHIPTGRSKQWYVNPQRDMPEEAFRVHGLSAEFLARHPVFTDVVDDFLDFIADAPLVIHNAGFDMKFVNAELDWASRPVLPMSRAIDTVTMARQKLPGARYSLDALCQRFGVDLSGRDKHGALLDASLLAEVYLELLGGRQAGLELAANAAAEQAITVNAAVRPPRAHAPSEAELAAHAAFVAKLKSPLWLAE